MTTVTKSFEIAAWRMCAIPIAESSCEEPLRFSVDVTVIGPLLGRSGYIAALNAMEKCLRPAFSRAHVRDHVLTLGVKKLTITDDPHAISIYVLEHIAPEALHPAELIAVSAQVRMPHKEPMVAVLPQDCWQHAADLLRNPAQLCHLDGLAYVEAPIDNSLFNVVGQQTASQRHAQKTHALRLMGDYHERPKDGDDAEGRDDAVDFG